MQNVNTLDNNAVTTVPNETQTVRPQRHRKQSIRSLEQLAAMQGRLNKIEAHAELTTLLAARGYDATRFAEGAALYEMAMDGFVQRQKRIGALRDAYAVSNAALQVAREDFVEFRASARALLTTAALRSQLDLDAPIPEDAHAFLGLVQMVYRTTRETPALTETLGSYGYSADRMAELQAHLDTAAVAVEAVDLARANAKQATIQRNRATHALESWMARLTTAARQVSRKRPDLLTLLT